MVVMAAVVHIIDDDALFRSAIARLLRASGYDVKLHESAQEFLQSPCFDSPSCLLLDIEMPGLSGVDLQSRLAETNSTVPIVFLTGHGNIPASVRAIRAGAEDFLTKPVAKDDLLAAVERALFRHREVQAKGAKLEGARALLATLTPRELQVFALVVRGKMNKQIAYELGAAERTVKAHRHMIMEKLRVRSWAEAVLIAERLGVVPDDGLGGGDTK